jgi:ApbE superfamily uncharacterized protein (UPF0280 family)
MYQPRTYRRFTDNEGLVSFNVVVKETDLFIRAVRDLQREALEAVAKHRMPLEQYIGRHPLFLHSLEPFAVGPDAPDIVKEMAEVSGMVGVGPMAAVAGAIAEAVGKELLVYSPEIIIENGGDIFVKIVRPRLIGIYAGESQFTGKIALEISPEKTPMGICTSSGTVGPSLSLGAADAAIVIAHSTALADAAATAIGNKVLAADDIDEVIEQVKTIPQLVGAVIVKGDRMWVWGDIKLISL